MGDHRPLRQDELLPICLWWQQATDEDLLDVSGSEAQEIILDLFATIAALQVELDGRKRAAMGQASLPMEVGA